MIGISLAAAAALALLPGRYASIDQRIEARVEQASPGRLRVELVGGGLPNGTATAADCTIVAEGRRRSGTVVLRAVPFTASTQEVTSADLQHTPVTVTARPVRGGAVIATKGTLPCGVGSSLDGRLYRKAKQPGETLIQK